MCRPKWGQYRLVGAVPSSNIASLRQPLEPLPRPLSDTERGAKGQAFLPLPSQGRGLGGLGFNASGVKLGEYRLVQLS